MVLLNSMVTPMWYYFFSNFLIFSNGNTRLSWAILFYFLICFNSFCFEHDKSCSIRTPNLHHYVKFLVGPLGTSFLMVQHTLRISKHLAQSNLLGICHSKFLHFAMNSKALIYSMVNTMMVMIVVWILIFWNLFPF